MSNVSCQSLLLSEVQAVRRHRTLGLPRHHQLRPNGAQNLARLRSNGVAVARLNLPGAQIVQRLPEFRLEVAGVEFRFFLSIHSSLLRFCALRV